MAGDAFLEGNHQTPTVDARPNSAGIHEGTVCSLVAVALTGVTGGQRRGAPDDHNFDTQAGVQKDLDHVDEASASGPGAHNTYMPPYGPMPTDDERADLGRWIACGAP